MNIFKNKKDIDLIKDRLKKTFSGIREELDNHLDSINENTNEIQTNYEYMCEIDSKVDKLQERMDEISYVLGIMQAKTADSHKINLKMPEQEVFLLLYTLPQKQTITVDGLAKKIDSSKKSIASRIGIIRSKGVPIEEVSVDGNTHYFLDEKFANYQTKNKVVKIDSKLIKYLNL